MLDGLIPWLYHVAGDYFATNQCPGRGDSRVTGGYACYTVYPTQDGKYVTVGALEEKFWRNLCQAVGREDLISEQYVPERQEELKKIFTQIFLTKTRDEWLENLKDIDICFGPVKSIAETFRNPQVLHRQMLLDALEAQMSKIPQLGIPIKLSETPGRTRRPAPELGENNDEILKSLGYSGKEIEEMRANNVF